MPEQAIAGILIIHTHFERGKQRKDRLDDLLTFFVLDQAVFHVDDLMRLLTVHTGVGAFFAVVLRHPMHLVAVAEGVLHPPDRHHLPKAFQKLFYLFLLLLQLLFV